MCSLMYIVNCIIGMAFNIQYLLKCVRPFKGMSTIIGLIICYIVMRAVGGRTRS